MIYSLEVFDLGCSFERHSPKTQWQKQSDRIQRDQRTLFRFAFLKMCRKLRWRFNRRGATAYLSHSLTMERSTYILISTYPIVQLLRSLNLFLFAARAHQGAPLQFNKSSYREWRWVESIRCFATNSFWDLCASVPVCDVLCYYSGLCTNQCQVGRSWWEKQMKLARRFGEVASLGMILREYWILVGMRSFLTSLLQQF